MNRAWHSVKREPVTNCFKHAFSFAPANDETPNKGKSFDPLGDVALPRNMDKGTFEDLVNGDVAEAREQTEERKQNDPYEDENEEEHDENLKKLPQTTALLPLVLFVSFVSNNSLTSAFMRV